MENGTYYIGSQLKFEVEITADGFVEGTDDCTIVVQCGGVKKEYDNDDLVDDGNVWYLLVDTSDFGAGVMTATIIADVADSLFTTRTEVAVVELCCLRSVP